MRLKGAITILLVLLAQAIALAQYFQFSQYNYTENRANPAANGSSEYAKFSFVHRIQKVADNLNINSTFISGSYPIWTKSGPRLNIELSFLDDRAGEVGIFRSNIFSGNVAAAIPVARDQFLSFGLKTDWQYKSVSFDNLTTGNQFVVDRGFIGGSSGEIFEQFSSSFLTFSTGLNWVKMDGEGFTLSNLGFSIYDINQPNEAFFSTSSKLPSTFVVNIKSAVYDGLMWRLSPDLLYTNTASNNNMVVGMVTAYKLNNGKVNGHLNLISRYNLAGYAVLGVQFENKRTSFGVSYDIPITSQVGNLGTLELGFQLKKYIDPITLSKRVKKSKYAKRREKFKRQQAKKVEKNNDNKEVAQRQQKTEDQSETNDSAKLQLLDSLITQKVDSIVIEEEADSVNNLGKGSASAGELDRFPLDEPIYFDFKFGFNKTALSKSDKETLNDLVLLLIQNDAFTVEIIGHTDDAGPVEYNKKLSESRAEAVGQYLIQKGIESERISTIGKGEEDPSVVNNSEENRAINRRVEFVIHKFKTQINDR